jgi:uncharacterized membrane protein HdeD (DUF308 family)
MALLSPKAVPKSRTLRISTGVLLLLAGFASIVFLFISAAAVTLAFGAVAVMAWVSQLLRICAATAGRAKLFRVLAGVIYLVGGGLC